MPLIEKNGQMLPDDEGGWYWLKQSDGWKPVKVWPATVGWPATIQTNSTCIDVDQIRGRWGPQIVPPND